MADSEDAKHDEEKVEAAMADSKMASLFDVRLVVGGLITLYGVILTIMGFLDSQKAIDKAAGVRINLWTGIVLLVVGLFFLLWMRVRPLHADPKAKAGKSDRPAH